MQSCQSFHCSNTCTKWAYIRQIPSVNARRRLGMLQSRQSLHCFAHAQIGRTYGIFFQSILRRDLVCMQSCRSLSLLSHVHKMRVHMAYSISQCSYAPEHACCLARAFIALAHAQNGRSYGIFFQSKLKRALASV